MTQRINSQSYWDGRFATDWDDKQGPQQSRFFSRVAIDNLPAWLFRAIGEQQLSVVDWVAPRARHRRAGHADRGAAAQRVDLLAHGGAAGQRASSSHSVRPGRLAGPARLIRPCRSNGTSCFPPTRWSTSISPSRCCVPCARGLAWAWFWCCPTGSAIASRSTIFLLARKPSGPAPERLSPGLGPGGGLPLPARYPLGGRADRHGLWRGILAGRSPDAVRLPSVGRRHGGASAFPRA
jgi:hypothetical protein